MHMSASTVTTEMNETIQTTQRSGRDSDLTMRDVHKADAGIDIRITIETVEDIVIARQEGRALANSLGFSATDATLIATAISELARNIVLYAKTGEIMLSTTVQGERTGLVIIGKDNGPGIANLVHAMMNGYSTSGGLGLGLPGVKKIMDSFDISSEQGQGTIVTTIMLL
jgi:serine/threonine-protein kinase RsbT